MIITFIAKGDDMLRAIFHMEGGGGDTVKNAAATMLQIKGAAKLAHNAKNAVTSKFNRNSRLGQAAGFISDINNDFSHSVQNNLDDYNSPKDASLILDDLFWLQSFSHHLDLYPKSCVQLWLLNLSI